MKEEIGCGKDIEIIWNFGRKVIVKCGFQEEGFMPNLCASSHLTLTISFISCPLFFYLLYLILLI